MPGYRVFRLFLWEDAVAFHRLNAFATIYSFKKNLDVT